MLARRPSARSLTRAAVLALTVAAVGTVSASQAHAADDIPAVGVNDIRSDGILMPHGGWQGAGDLDLLRQAGVSLYRGRMRMDCVARTADGGLDFSAGIPACSGLSYDDLVAGLADRGLTYLPVLVNFGGSATAGASPVPPTADGAGDAPSRAEFAAFAAAAAQRYGSTGTFWATCGCPAKPIRAWQVWNEENNGWWWGGRASPVDYAATYRETRAALRRADPAARAIVGGLTWDRNGQASFASPEAMLRELARGGAAFDAVALHPYTDARGRTARQLADAALGAVTLLAERLRRIGGEGADGAPRHQIWITEMGWSTTDATPQVIADAFSIFLAKLDGGARRASNVGPVMWYMLRDNASTSARDDQLGMRATGAGGEDAGPKPVWEVFAAAARRSSPLALPAGGGDAPRAGVRISAATHAAGRRVRLTVTCPATGQRCGGAIRVRATLPGGAATVARGTLTLRAGRAGSVDVALASKATSVLRRRGALRVQVSVGTTSASNVVTTTLRHR